MSRTTCNVVVDLAAFGLALFLLSTGLVMRYVLPPCEGGGGGGALLGWGRHDWGGLHFGLAVALGLLVIVHLALHWGWVCAMAGRAAGRGAAEGAGRGRALAGGAVLLGLAVATVGVVWAGQAAVVRGGGGCADGSGCAGAVRGCGAGKALPACSACPGAAEPRATRAGEGGPPVGSAAICGSMTLDEAARQAGCDLVRLRRALGLPDDVAGGEILRDVIARHGLTMPEVRRRLGEPPGGR